MAHQNRGFQLVVSPGRITSIGLDVTRGIRRIYLNRDHLANPPLTSWGDSVAHWEADTNSLVVDTIGFDDKSFLDLEGGRHSTELHVVEKWKFVADGKWLEKTWIVEDPRALKAPYTFVRYHQKLPATNEFGFRSCLDQQSWKDWVGLYNDAVRWNSDMRAKAAKEMGQSSGSEIKRRPKN